MADNYLETRYEQVFSQKGGARRSLPSKPSLETLLSRYNGLPLKGPAENIGADSGTSVHRLQLEAVMRCAEYYDFNLDGHCCDNGSACICFEHGSRLFEAGALAQVLALKATELGLWADVLVDENLVTISLWGSKNIL